MAQESYAAAERLTWVVSEQDLDAFGHVRFYKYHDYSERVIRGLRQKLGFSSEALEKEYRLALIFLGMNTTHFGSLLLGDSVSVAASMAPASYKNTGAILINVSFCVDAQLIAAIEAKGQFVPLSGLIQRKPPGTRIPIEVWHRLQLRSTRWV